MVPSISPTLVKQSRIVILLLWLLITAACASTPDFTQAIKKSEDLMAMQQRAETLYQNKQYTEANLIYADLVQKIPEEPDVWYRFGNSLARANNLDLAIAAYRQTLQRNPEHARAWHNLAYVQIQAVQTTLGEMSQYLTANDPLLDSVREHAQKALLNQDVDERVVYSKR